MLRSTLKSWANLLLIFVILTPTLARALTSADADQIDLSILEQRDALLPYMTPQQKYQYLQQLGDIKRAESDIWTGQIMANTQPSTLDPSRDIKPTIERGKKMIEKAQQSLAAAQKEMVALLTTVEGQKIQVVAIDATRFDYAIESAHYKDALTAQSQQLLETCWELGYETLFFDGIFIQDSEGMHRADADLRNGAYDILVKIDGTRFSVTIPVDIKLKADTQGNASHIFKYENELVFKDDKKALLVIELIRPKDSSTGLLSLRAIDLESQLIAAQKVIKIDDIVALLNIDAEGLEDQVPTELKLRDEANTLETLSNLDDPYTFALETHFDTTEVAELLTYTLLRNTHLALADSDFILRAYGESLDMPDAWQGQANARLTIEEDKEAESYQLSAQADGSDRVLSAGTLTLVLPEPTRVVTPVVAGVE